MENLTNKDGEQTSSGRLAFGEAWVWCTDCNAKLYSFDGKEDKGRPCPTPRECRELNEKLNPR